jgi:hypothetical protein
MADVTPLGPLITAHLFPTLDARLIDLLRSLTPEDWERQTIAPRWKVKDVAAHLLDTQLRKLSFGRDGYIPSPPPAIASDRDLVSFIDRLNAEGVTVYRRLSPATGIGISVTGDCGGAWHLYRGDGWLLANKPVGTIAATVTIPQEIAWRIFTKGIARENARAHVGVTGDAALGCHVLDMLAIVG